MKQWTVVPSATGWYSIWHTNSRPCHKCVSETSQPPQEQADQRENADGDKAPDASHAEAEAGGTEEEPPDAAVDEKPEESSGAPPSINPEQHAPAPVETADPSILLYIYILYYVLSFCTVNGWMFGYKKNVSKNTSNQIT